MSVSIPGAFNQGVYPGALADSVWDDCWAVATLWCVHYTDRAIDLPTVTKFREAAGNPDDPGVDGGTLAQVMRACRTLWPDLPVVRHRAKDWTPVEAALSSGGAVSLAVISKFLPANLRFRFDGAHQIAVVRDGAAYLVMNPLAPQGSAPIECPLPVLQEAARRFGLGYIFAALFPPAKETDVKFLIPDGSPALGTATAIRDTRLWRWDGARIDLSQGASRQVYGYASVDGALVYIVRAGGAKEAHFLRRAHAEFKPVADPDDATIADLRGKLDAATNKIVAAKAALE